MRALVRPRLLEGRGLLTLLLVGAVVLSLFSVQWSRDVVHAGGAASVAQLLKALFTPDVSPSFLRLAVEATWRTVSYAVAAMTLAVAVGLAMGAVASGVLGSGRVRLAGILGARLFLAASRAIHELVWAWLFIAAIGVSPMAGVLALAIPYAGILGRIYADLLSDVPEAPLRALRSSGASELKVLLYGRLPMALPGIVSYTFYRLECGVRSAAILSFVGIQGLGYQVQLSLDELLYSQVWTLLLFLIALVAAVDAWSSIVRRSLTS